MTKIQWTNRVWNPIVGCSKVSAGCKNCYAIGMAWRLQHIGHSAAKYAGTVEKTANGQRNWTGKINLSEKDLLKPLEWKTPKMIFVNSESDLFHENVPFEFIDKVFAVMALCPHHTFQVLTKRPARMKDYLTEENVIFRIAKAADTLSVDIKISKSKYELRPIPGIDNYFIDNTGQVFTSNGSANCVWCGTDFENSRQDSLYCSQKCRSASHYAKKMGGNYEPVGRTLRCVKQDSGEDGHKRVWIVGGDRELVHRLVLRSFDRESTEGEQGCHIDGNPERNHICNLRWGLQTDNWKDRIRHGKARSYSKITEVIAKEIRARASNNVRCDTIAKEFNISITQVRNIVNNNQWNCKVDMPWPLLNCWLGASIENQQTAAERIPYLLQTPAAVRFLSCEPLLGPVDLTHIDADGAGHKEFCQINALTGRHTDMARPCPDVNKIDWCIVGGESGKDARPMHLKWARDLRDQCTKAGVKYFFKQWGAWAMCNFFASEPGQIWLGDDGIKHDCQPRQMMCYGRQVIAMKKVGKEKAGRLLDGREWNEFPGQEKTTEPAEDPDLYCGGFD